MSRSGTTKDEQFLITLYHKARSSGDQFGEFDRYEVGQAIGQNDRSVNNIVRMLMQTNFIKKGEGNKVFLTPNGIRLIEESLLN